jgi:hypothetical protein
MLKAMAGAFLGWGSSSAMIVELLQAWLKQHVKQGIRSGAMRGLMIVVTITADPMKQASLHQEGLMTQVRGMVE